MMIEMAFEIETRSEFKTHLYNFRLIFYYYSIFFLRKAH